jgi:flagellar basal body-associated protein FliL
MGKKKLIIIIVAVVLVLAIIGVVAVVLINNSTKEKPIVYYEIQLDEEYSNLADTNSAKIVKYRVTIEYTDEKMLAEIEKNKTRIRNNIDEIMRSTLSEDIAKANGKQRLRDRIKDMVIDVLDTDEDVITNIYIQPFVVQG